MKPTTITGEEVFTTSRDLELQILAELISDSSLMRIPVGRLSSNLFTDPDCRHLWDWMVDRYNRRLTIDPVTVYEAGCNDFLINDIVPLFNNIYTDERIMREHIEMLCLESMRRVISVEALKLIRDCRTASMTELIASTEKLAQEAKGACLQDNKSHLLADVSNELLDDISSRQAEYQKGKLVRVPTSFKSLDMLTYSGFAPGNLVILAARPSVGKTAIMLQMAISAAEAGFTPSLFGLEMGNKELVQRMIVGTGLVTQKEIAHGAVVWDNMEKANDIVGSRKMYLYDDKYTVGEISSQIVMNCHQGICSIAFIDYLGLISHTGRNTTAQEVADITKRIKRLAKDCGIPIVLLCQLNRASVIDDRPPQLNDLRDSGSIEQDADIVLMIERNGHGEQNRQSLNMWVRKNRQGKAGDVFISLRANETFTQFEDCGAQQYQPVSLPRKERSCK